MTTNKKPTAAQFEHAKVLRLRAEGVKVESISSHYATNKAMLKSGLLSSTLIKKGDGFIILDQYEYALTALAESHGM